VKEIGKDVGTYAPLGANVPHVWMNVLILIVVFQVTSSSMSACRWKIASLVHHSREDGFGHSLTPLK